MHWTNWPNMSILMQILMQNTSVLDMMNIAQDCSNLYSELHMKISHVVNDLEYGMDASRLLRIKKIQCFITRECENIWTCRTQRSHKLVTHDLVCLIPHLACLSVMRVAIRDFLTGELMPGNLVKYGLSAPASAFRLPPQLTTISFLWHNNGHLMGLLCLFLHWAFID